MDSESSPEKVYQYPTSTKARKNKSNLQIKFKCPYCLNKWVNKKEAKNHKRKCKNKSTVREDTLKQIEQRQKLDQDRHEIMEQIQSHQTQTIRILSLQLESFKSQLNDIKKVLPQFNQIRSLNNVENILEKMIQPQSIISILKSVLGSQVDTLLLSGFEAKDIILEGRKAVQQNLQNFEILRNFTNHKKNMSTIQSSLAKEHSKQNQKYSKAVALAFKFINKFSQKQLKIQTNIIQQISEMSFYKRKLITALYSKIQSNYPDMFKFPNLPKRLAIRQGGNKIKRRRINVDILFDDVKRLLTHHQYDLACDIWASVCLGLRQSQYQCVKFQRGTGQIAKIIRLTERKNQNQICRLIPKSLANMIKKHDVFYPITAQRLKFVKQYCLKNYGSFYSLRSLSISLILSKIAQRSQFGRFHKAIETTGKYYLDLEIEGVINNIFYMSNYDENVQAQLQVICSDGFVDFKNISHPTQIDFTQNAAFIDESFKDSILMNEIQEKELTLQNGLIRKQLENQIQIGQRSIQNLIKDKPVKQYLSSISYSQDLNIKVLSANETQQSINLIQNFNPGGNIEVRLIQIITPRQNTKIFVDQSKIETETFIKSLKSFEKSKFEVLRNYITCFECRKRLFTDNCKDHFLVRCQVHGQFHECGNIISNLTSERRLINVSETKFEMKLEQIELCHKQNNIKQKIKEVCKKYLKRIVYQTTIPQFKVNMPSGNQKLFKNIKHVQENQSYIPVQIRQTKLGYGVFATQNIPSNTLVCTYTGQVRQGSSVNNKDDSIVECGMFKHQGQPVNLLLTCDTFANVGRFFNSSSSFQSKSKNLQLQKTIDSQNRLVYIMYTIKPIQKNQQMKWFYGEQYWVSSPITALSDSEEESDDQRDIKNYQDMEEMQAQINMKEKGKVEQNEIKNIKNNAAKALIIKNKIRTLEMNSSKVIQIASIIKIINAKVCLAFIDDGCVGWDTELQHPLYFQDGATRAYLQNNKMYKIDQLFYGMLVPSGCDAAYCLAFGLGKLVNSLQPVKQFVELMNRQALALGMKDTKIVEPTGYGTSVSTAEDLIKLAQWMKDQSRIHKYLKCESKTIVRKVKNTNSLLHKNIIGKTGFGWVDNSSFVGFNDECLFTVLGCREKLVTFYVLQMLIKRIGRKQK